MAVQIVGKPAQNPADLCGRAVLEGRPAGADAQDEVAHRPHPQPTIR
jgi:hypothetical protein